MRSRLERAEYWRTRVLPAYPTRLVFPLHDLHYAWSHRLGRPPELSSCSRPGVYHRRFARRHPQAFRLYQLFFLHRNVPEPDLPGLIHDGLARAQVAAIGETYILSSIPGRSPGEFVYLGDDSTLLIREARAHPGQRALDMACGCGVIGLNLPACYAEVDGLDLNPTAIRLACSNLLLNPRTGVRFAVSDMWEGARGRYDLVIGNPPALPLPAGDRDLGFARGGTDPAELTLRFVAGLPEHLAPDGLAIVSSFSLAGRLWDQLQLPPGFSLDYHIRERIRLTDPDSPFIDHVLLKIRHDGRHDRRQSGPTWWERLSRLPGPGEPEPFPQAERLRPTPPRSAAPGPLPPA